MFFMAKKIGQKLIAQNKKAYHDYFMEETFQAGIELVGTEVKSMRLGKCSFRLLLVSNTAKTIATAFKSLFYTPKLLFRILLTWMVKAPPASPFFPEKTGCILVKPFLQQM